MAASLQSNTKKITLTGLSGSAGSFLLARLLKETPRLFIAVTADGDAAEELYRELRFYAEKPDEILHFPAWDVTPLGAASPHANITGERLNTMFRLMSGQARVVVTPYAAAVQKVLPRQTLGDLSQYLIAGEEVPHDELLGKLVKLGYSPVPLVEDRGGFSARGGIVDIFPPNLPHPVRIEFFGDFVETIRTFDPLTQRSLHPMEELVLLPSREVILAPEVMKEFTGRLKRLCDDLDIAVPRRRELVEQLNSSIYPPGIENLLPLFHGPLETLFDYAGPAAVTTLFDMDAIVEARQEWLYEIEKSRNSALEEERIICDATAQFISGDGALAENFPGVHLHLPKLELLDPDAGETFNFPVEQNSDLKIIMTADGEGVMKPLAERLSGWLKDEVRVLIPCHQRGQAERLMSLLEHYELPLKVAERSFCDELFRRERGVSLLIGEMSRGFRLASAGIVVVTEEELFGKRVRRRGVSEMKKKQILTSLAELKVGDFMVHLDFGVGEYRGLEHIELGGSAGDFILLEYHGGDRLYLPVDRMALVQRYVGAEGLEPRVDRLGGVAWDKAKAKAREAVEEMAAELLEIYAARAVQKGFAFSPPDDLYKEFEASFAWDETPDQLSAIDDVLQDMMSERPMDRLVCGDVGYGKTEVAIRAAFKAVMDGRQVAVLVPTTILAQQHFESFRERFKDYPVTVEMLSRFRTAKEQKVILEDLSKGKVDVIIGTHRILQKDIEFRELGLLVVDEEQRFGVVHKERLKKFRATVDIMTLTATPIPRTLYMSMMGVRDLSIIDTPPVDRLAIKTFVARFNEELIREAVMRELRRGGQVFFVHNRVQSIGLMAEHLARIVPEAKIAVAHGQMKEGELEKVMLGFMHAETNILLCTTIIESGLDIPSANTLIVNRADAFGLAQLYQLRGRVGRSKVRAFAYFLIPAEGAIAPDSRERLKILQDISELGAGFRIATHDLEIRGAGDILGAKQSGQIAAVGFELFTELLEETISRLKGEDITERVEPEIKLRIPAFIPEDFVKDANQRLVLYKKLTQVVSEEEVTDISAEIVDRYGKAPLAVEYLLETMKLRILFKKFLVKEAEFDGKRLTFAFHEKTPVSPDTIIAMIRNQPKKYQFTPDFKLTAELTDTSFDGVLLESRNLLKKLGGM
ncbi:MAG: transcription-repair coupling factor [Geobacteraceae bacterium]|nr:transcription-repair coupling factor [Geobacteraceae bacterium]